MAAADDALAAVNALDTAVDSLIASYQAFIAAVTAAGNDSAQLAAITSNAQAELAKVQAELAAASPTPAPAPAGS